MNTRVWEKAISFLEGEGGKKKVSGPIHRKITAAVLH
jgi:hypothetical protein